MTTVTEKGSTPSAPGQTAPKQESVFLVTMKATAPRVTLGSGLVLAEKTTTPTPVETTLPTKTERPLGIYLCSKRNRKLSLSCANAIFCLGKKLTL